MLWGLTGLGVVTALYVFMADSLHAARHGLDMTAVLPTDFKWSVFIVALALMAAPVANIAWNLRRKAIA